MVHDNPDPDSIASAFALKYILKKAAGVQSVITYGGIIGRSENKQMVQLLDIDMIPVIKVNPNNYSYIAFVDCQPYTGNVHIPKNVKASIVIDHHPVRKQTLQADFIDVRKEIGSTSTIITQYIRTLGIKMDRKVATALWYGIKTDIRGAGRISTEADERAFAFLYPFILQKTLSKIENPNLPREYFNELFSILKSAMVYDDAVVAKVEKIAWPEMIGEFADELIRIEGIRWCMCYGRHNGGILFSIRTTRANHMAGVLANKICHGIGSGGGHETFAAGRIDMAQAMKKVKDPEETLLRRFLREASPKEVEPKPLIDRMPENNCIKQNTPSIDSSVKKAALPQA
jgi:nanoRNase/pAp phosphatase (c-di-AMP/oligoRNAs hydrolase)